MASPQEEKVCEGDEDEKQKVAVGDKRKAERKVEEGFVSRDSSLLSMKIGKKTKSGTPSGISIKVGSMKSTEKKTDTIISKPKKGSVAAAFNDESDEEEEIPKEAKMRMKNIGKDTATSAGPNSFNKGKQGFTNYGKLMEKATKLSKE